MPSRGSKAESPYQAYVLPGIIVMAALFGGMLTAIATVYDREFGMLRLMLASPAGIPAILAGRALAATLVAILQGGIVLACAPLIMPLTTPGIDSGGRGARRSAPWSARHWDCWWPPGFARSRISPA